MPNASTISLHPSLSLSLSLTPSSSSSLSASVSLAPSSSPSLSEEHRLRQVQSIVSGKMSSRGVNVEANDSEGEGNNDICEVTGDGSQIWTTTKEQMFISLMEEEVLKGNRPTTTFSKESWHYLRNELSKRAKFNYSDIQLRNKFNQLRQVHREFSKLIKETGIGYNSLTGQVTATEEVWQRLYVVHKKAKRFRKRGCPMYEKLCVIYGDTTASGALAHPSTKSPSDSNEREKDPDFNVDDQSDDAISNVRANDKLRVRTQSTVPSTKRHGKKANFSAALTCALNSISENSKRKTEVWERLLGGSPSRISEDITSDSASESNPKFLNEALEALHALVDIDGQAYTKAVEKFHDDALWRQIFLKMPETRRKDWVLNLK